MRTLLPLEKLRSALQSSRLSSPSKPWISVIGKAWLDTGRRTRPPCRETSARKNSTWRYGSASVTARRSAHQTGSPASQLRAKLGTRLTLFPPGRKQSSYFSPDIALPEKIISLDPTLFIRSTDHDRPGPHPLRRR